MLSELLLAYINLALFLIVLVWLAKGAALKAAKEAKGHYQALLVEASQLTEKASTMKNELSRKRQALPADLERLRKENMAAANLEIRRIEEETQGLVSFFQEETTRLEAAEFKRVKKEIADRVLVAAGHKLAMDYANYKSPLMDAQILTAKTKLLQAKCQELEQNHG